MLAVGANVRPGLHDSSMTFEAAALERAVGVLIEACSRAAAPVLMP